METKKLLHQHPSREQAQLTKETILQLSTKVIQKHQPKLQIWRSIIQITSWKWIQQHENSSVSTMSRELQLHQYHVNYTAMNNQKHTSSIFNHSSSPNTKVTTWVLQHQAQHQHRIWKQNHIDESIKYPSLANSYTQVNSAKYSTSNQFKCSNNWHITKVIMNTNQHKKIQRSKFFNHNRSISKSGEAYYHTLSITIQQAMHQSQSTIGQCYKS